MFLRNRAGVYLAAIILSALLVSFGVLLLVQGAIHKVSIGEAELRDITVERSVDPIWFWVSVGIDAVAGAALVIAGSYGFWSTFKRRRTSKHPKESS